MHKIVRWQTEQKRQIKIERLKKTVPGIRTRNRVTLRGQKEKKDGMISLHNAENDHQDDHLKENG